MRRSKKKDFVSQLAQSLGASRVIGLSNLPSGGPLDLLQLRADMARRLKSTGGRPTDPGWKVQRLVPFGEDRWRRLEELAEELSSSERKISPGQLAAILIERALDAIPDSEGQP